MSFFKKIFSKNPEPATFSEGDIFYSILKNRYHLYKLLKHDEQQGTYHVLCYEPQDQLPSAEQFKSIGVFAWHAPIDSKGFGDPVLFAKSEVTHEDRTGYYEYLRQSGNQNELFAYAKYYYEHAYELTDLKQHDAAIQHYSNAIDIFPDFFEAIDNRAFCKMDQGKWTEAIADFELSLQVKPNSVLAIFSIGECYFKMNKWMEAIAQFEKALAIEPNNQHALRFRKMTADKIRGK